MKIQIVISACAALLLSGCMSYSGTYRQDLAYRDYGAYDAPAYYDDDPYYQDGYYGDGYYGDGYYGDSWYYDDYYGGYRDPFLYGGNYGYCWSPYDFDCRRDPFAGWLGFGGSHFWLMFGNYRGWPDYYGYGYGNGWPYWWGNYPYYPHGHHHHRDRGDDPDQTNGPPQPPPPRDNGSLPPRDNGSIRPGGPGDWRGIVHREREPEPTGDGRDSGGRWTGNPNNPMNTPPPRDNGSRLQGRYPEDRRIAPPIDRRDDGSAGGNEPAPIRWRAPTVMPTPMPPRDNGQMRYPVAPVDRGGGAIQGAQPMPPPAYTPRPPSAPVVRPVRPITSPPPTPTNEPTSGDNDNQPPLRNRRRDDGSGGGQ